MRPLALLLLPLVACTITNPLFAFDTPEVTTTTPATTAPVTATDPTTDDPLPATDTLSPTTTDPLPADSTTTGPVDPVTTGDLTSTDATLDTTTDVPTECSYAGEFPIDPQIYVSLDPKTPMKACKQLVFTAKGALTMTDGVLAIHQAGGCDEPEDGPLHYFGLGYPAPDLALKCAEIRVAWSGPMSDCRIGALEVRNVSSDALIYLGAFDQPAPPDFPLQPELHPVNKCGCDLPRCCAPLDPGQYTLKAAGVVIDPGTAADLATPNGKVRFHNFRSHVTPECQRDAAAGHSIEWFAAAL